MNVEELIDTLKCIGLTDYESKAYAALLLKGHSKASYISREANVPQSKIYEVLERLAQKRLIEVYNVRPKEFKAIAPASVLTSLVQEKEAEITQVKKRLLNVLKLLNSAQESEEGIWTSKENNSEDFFKRAYDLYERSKDYVYMAAKNFYWPSKVAECVHTCCKRGVDIKVLCTDRIDERSYYRAKWLKDCGIEIRAVKMRQHPSLLDVDGHEVLIRLEGHNTKKNKFMFTTIYTRNISLVKVIDSYIKNLWKRATPIELW